MLSYAYADEPELLDILHKQGFLIKLPAPPPAGTDRGEAVQHASYKMPNGIIPPAAAHCTAFLAIINMYAGKRYDVHGSENGWDYAEWVHYNLMVYVAEASPVDFRLHDGVGRLTVQSVPPLWHLQLSYLEPVLDSPLVLQEQKDYLEAALHAIEAWIDGAKQAVKDDQANDIIGHGMPNAPFFDNCWERGYVPYPSEYYSVTRDREREEAGDDWEAEEDWEACQQMPLFFTQLVPEKAAPRFYAPVRPVREPIPGLTPEEEADRVPFDERNTPWWPGIPQRVVWNYLDG